jgi:hypothetical protein
VYGHVHDHALASTGDVLLGGMPDKRDTVGNSAL